ncbi:putative 3-methyl-2-oxobutanoate dehydrogenase (2-methylpropanoyl-transferring) [Helianthus annuus]|nr:putative 3-methyl-2-oxobutanoate dehydrogenase (2-methylpropanoyl-transferring) [Helianthus annuus]
MKMASYSLIVIRLSKEVAVKMYRDMVTLQVMDTIFYEAQRQGRISFYLTTIGEEAINIASAAALSHNDFVFPQVTLRFIAPLCNMLGKSHVAHSHE